jgi:hypothetical protein
MDNVSRATGLYLAVLQFVFTLGWTTYAYYLPQLAASAGIAAGTVVVVLMLDQAIFTIADFAMGVAADKASRVLGRLGYCVAATTLISCAAFVALPFVAPSGLGPVPFLALTVVWAATSSALRAPPLMLLGKYAARPSVPYLASLASLGIGIASAASPYLNMTLAKQDPRLPFVIASVALFLTSLALTRVERSLAKTATAKSASPIVDRPAVPASVPVFAATAAILALGFQLYFFFDSATLFRRFTADIARLMPVFWIGFSLGMFPAGIITRRFGGLMVMGGAGLTGAAAIAVAELSGALPLTVAAQVIAGAAWGFMLVSAITAAAALGATGREGKITGLLFSTLALATLARMATGYSGALNDPSLTPLLRWLPLACWAGAGAVLLTLIIVHGRQEQAGAANKSPSAE